MPLTDHLLAVARAFCAARSLSLSRVSTIVFNDGKKLDAVVRGADLQTAKYEQAMAWFSANWPDGADWPSDVPRPVAQPMIKPLPQLDALRALGRAPHRAMAQAAKRGRR